MIKINLLPWREEVRQQKNNEFLAILGLVVVVALCLSGLVWGYVEYLENGQIQRNQYIQSELDVLKTKLQELSELEATKANLLARMNIIQQLQRSRPEVVHLFEEMVTTVPEGLWLTSIQQTDRTLYLEGRAESNARVSAYMRNLDASPWLQNPKLTVIQADDKDQVASFKLELLQESELMSEQEGEG